MRCEESIADLTALLQHELTPSREATLHEHLSSCQACRGELQNLTAVFRNLRRWAPLEPTARARRNLQYSLEDVISGRNNNEIPAERRLENKNPPKWLLVAPSATPLAYPQARQLPPVPDNKPPEDPQLAALSPTAREVSVRLSALSTRRPARPGLPALWVPAMLLTAAVAAAVWLVLTRDSQPPQIDFAARAQRMVSQRRLEARQTARARGKSTEALISSQVQLGNYVKDEALLWVLPHHDPDTGELCLIAYREKDLQHLRENTRVDQPAFAQLLRLAVEVTTRDGKCPLPQDMVERYVGIGHKAAIIELEDRIEIWSQPRLEKWLSCERLPSPAIPASNGLPVERIAR